MISKGNTVYHENIPKYGGKCGIEFDFIKRRGLPMKLSSMKKFISWLSTCILDQK